MSLPYSYDVLRFPLIGRFLRWRWGRFLLQLGLLLITAVLLYDGFSGPQLAPTNLATVVTWVHYRGLLILGLLLFGNLFCLACPFTLPRTLARRMSGNGRRWPRALRNKWLAIAIFFLYLWLYEWLDLWASPLLTAWLILAYFSLSFVLEALFAESPFCKYICPLGTFNFVGATISPTQITVRDRDTCHTCPGKECLNGSPQVLGCGTELFAPQISSNLDCVFCLDCARACPYDNVALAVRHPLREVTTPNAWPRRWDLHLLILIFAFTALGNAFGMTPPIYSLQATLANWLNTTGEGLSLLLILGLLNLVLPIAAGLGAAWLSRHLARRDEPLRHALARYAPAVLPLAFAIWLAHYAGFHFLSSALTILPVAQNFLLDHNLPLFGQPNWALGPILPPAWLDLMEMGVILLGFAASFYAVGLRAGRAEGRADSLVAQLPWLALLLILAAAALAIFYLPMEMRGTAFLG
jgi:polyferredoxin